MSVVPTGELSSPDRRPDAGWPGSAGSAGPSPSAPPTGPRPSGRGSLREVAGGSHTVEAPSREVGGARSGRAGGGEPERVDLRLHRPRPDVVIVRLSGTVDELTAPVVAARVSKQLHRAPHVVVDLGQVSVLGPQGRTVLFMLHQQAMTLGAQLHVVGVERDSLRRPLHARDLAQLVSFDATVDTVIAGLPLPVIPRGDTRGIGPDAHDPDPELRHDRDHPGPGSSGGPSLRLRRR